MAARLDLHLGTYRLILLADLAQVPLPSVEVKAAAAAPEPAPVSPEVIAALAKERDIARSRALADGKPEKILDKIVEGRLAKYYEEVCLLEQPFIKEQSITIKELIGQKGGKLGENITVRRFARFKVGAPDWTVAQTKAVEAAAE